MSSIAQSEPTSLPPGISSVIDSSDTAYKDDSYMYTLETDPVTITDTDDSFQWFRNDGNPFHWYADLSSIGPRGLQYLISGENQTPFESTLNNFLATIFPQYILMQYSQKQQRKENQRNREWQEQMYEKELKDARALRDEENAYENAWDERLRAKGYNPLMAISKGSTGSMGSNASRPSTGSPAVFNSMQTALGFLLALQDMKVKQAQIRNIEADTQGKSNENQSYWTRLGMELRTQMQDFENKKEQGRILRTEADIAEASKAGRIDEFNYNLRILYNEMRASEYKPEEASIDLQRNVVGLLSDRLQTVLQTNQITIQGQQIDLNNISIQQGNLILEELRITQPEKIASLISQYQSSAKIAEKEARWYTVDKIVDTGTKLTGMVTDIVSLSNPVVAGWKTVTENLGGDGSYSRTTQTKTPIYRQ